MNALNEFFKNLSVKMNLPSFFKANTLIFNNLFLALLALICLIALLLVIFLVPSKKQKEAKAKAAREKAEQERIAKELAAPDKMDAEEDDQGAQESPDELVADQGAQGMEEQTVDQGAQVMEEQLADQGAQVAEETPVEAASEEAAVEEEEPAEEAAPVEQAEPVETVASEEEVPAEEPVETAEPDADEELAAPEEALNEEPAEEDVAEDAPVEEVAAAEDSDAKVKNGGKYEIVKRNGAFYFLLKANNGQLLLESAAYTTLAGAKKAIETFKNAVEVGEFSIDEDKNGNFKFILRASARSQMLYHGETYATRQRAESAIGSVKKFALTDVIKRMEEDDEDDSAATPVETKPLSEADHKEGGKYEIEERNGSFYFLLKANNGQLLLESSAFTSEQGAKSGIDTFKKAADTGFFVVDVDKKGKFRFILRANARAQMRYYGESYSTRQSAENSVHSVRSFAQKAVLK